MDARFLLIVVVLFDAQVLVAPSSASASSAATPVVATTTAAVVAPSSAVQIQPTSTKATPPTLSTAVPTTKPTAQPVATTKPPAPAVVEIVTAARLTNEVYVAAYSDQSSPEYKNKSKEIKEKLEKVFDGANVTINSIVEGSIIVNYTLTLIVKAGYDPVANLIAMIKSGKLGGLTVDTTYIKIKENFKGVKLTEWKLDSASYLDKCCKSTIGSYKMIRVCTAKSGGSCYGIKLEYEEDCGKASGPPTCRTSKACSLANMSLVTMLMGFIASKMLLKE